MNIDVSHALNMIHPVATALLDEQLNIFQTSSGFGRMIGAENDQLCGQPLTDVLWEFVGVEQYLRGIFLGESERFLLDNINRQMPDGTNQYLSYQVLGNMEQTIPATLLLVIEDRSDVGRLQQSLIQDRNELRLARKQLTTLNSELAQLNHLKSLFLSMAAHDLRTPLASIQGYAELLRDDLADDDLRRRDLFDVILSQTYRLQQLINDLLDLDQIERGEIAIMFRDCFLCEIVNEVVMAMVPLSHRAGVAVEVSCPKETLRITADPQRISQILYNLLGNAIKFTPAGGHVRLMVRVQNGNVLIEIADDGVGISKSDVKDLFMPYFPQGKKNKGGRSGTGLGLYIVKLLVEAHNGQISVESSLGKGTTFSIVLPASQANGI